mgnify:CR=1 FL=1
MILVNRHIVVLVLFLSWDEKNSVDNSSLVTSWETLDTDYLESKGFKKGRLMTKIILIVFLTISMVFLKPLFILIVNLSLKLCVRMILMLNIKCV